MESDAIAVREFNQGNDVMSTTKTRYTAWKPISLFPREAWAICDGWHVLEDTGTGRLQIYYDKSDAQFAMPGVKKHSPENFDLKLRKIELAPTASDGAK